VDAGLVLVRRLRFMRLSESKHIQRSCELHLLLEFASGRSLDLE
jgi:hypothetical protein